MTSRFYTILQYKNEDEHDKFHIQFSWAWKKFINLKGS